MCSLMLIVAIIHYPDTVIFHYVCCQKNKHKLESVQDMQCQSKVMQQLTLVM